MFKMRREKCGLCGSKLNNTTNIMQYLATNEAEQPEMFSMAICDPCADQLDKETDQNLSPQEVRDWLLRK